MNRNKRRKLVSSSRGILRQISSAEGINFPHLESFLSLSLRGEEMEITLLLEVVKEFSFLLSRKYWEELESYSLQSSLKELKRIVACVNSGKIPK